MLYSEEQEQLMHNPYFITLLQFLGLHMPEDVGLVFPRIPHFWTVQYLIDKASQIGDLTKGKIMVVKGRAKNVCVYKMQRCLCTCTKKINSLSLGSVYFSPWSSL